MNVFPVMGHVARGRQQNVESRTAKTIHLTDGFFVLHYRNDILPERPEMCPHFSVDRRGLKTPDDFVKLRALIYHSESRKQQEK
jgi:hypothetical protein